MPVAVTLRMSGDTAAPVAALARRLGATADHPPHLTLAVLPEDATRDLALAAAARLADGLRHLPVSLASLGLFTAPQPVLFLARSSPPPC